MLCLLAHGRAHAVHGGITTAEHYHPLAFQVDVGLGVLLEAQVVIDVADQVGERLVHTRQVLAGKTAAHGLVGPHAQKQGIVLFHQLGDGDILADIGVETELDTHALEDFPTPDHHLFLQLEFGYPEGQQAADLGIAVEDDRLDPGAHQHIGAAKSGGTGADNGDFLAGGHDFGHVRAPAHGQRGIGNVLLRGADSNRAKAVVQGAGALAEPVLGAYPAADLGQGIGLVAEFRRLEQIALADQLEPVGNEIVYRTLPFTVGIAAFNAAVRLFRRLLGGEGFVDLDVFGLARRDRLLVRVVATDINKLEVVRQTITHKRYASRRLVGVAQARQQLVEVRRLGLDQPELAHVILEVIQQFRPPG